MVDYLHQALKIDRIRTSSFSPQSNAQIERFWRTLDQQIRRNSTTFADVEELLIPATFALNNAVNSATGYPPIYLLMAFKPQTGTLFQKVPRAPSSIIACDNDQIIERENRRRETFQKVHKRIHDRAKYNKEYHDSKGIQVKREIGDQVLVSNHSIDSFANRKLVPKWVPASKGLPFQVVDTSNDGINLTLKDPVNEIRSMYILKIPDYFHTVKYFRYQRKGQLKKIIHFQRLFQIKRRVKYLKKLEQTCICQN